MISPECSHIVIMINNEDNHIVIMINVPDDEEESMIKRQYGHYDSTIMTEIGTKA